MPREPRPFREGLLTIDPPRLHGSRCSACGVTAFPAREFCPGCRAPEGIQPVELDNEGRVHSFTVVRQAPPGVEVPYILAWVDLPADDVRLLARVEGDVELDMPVSLALTPFDDELVGFCFRRAS